MTVKQLANEPATDRRGHRALEAQVPHLFNTQRRRSRPRRYITHIHSPLSLDMSTTEVLPTARVLMRPASTSPDVSMHSVSDTSFSAKSDVSMKTRSRSSSRSSQALPDGHLGHAALGQFNFDAITRFSPPWPRAPPLAQTAAEAGLRRPQLINRPLIFLSTP